MRAGFGGRKEGVDVALECGQVRAPFEASFMNAMTAWFWALL